MKSVQETLSETEFFADTIHEPVCLSYVSTTIKFLIHIRELQKSKSEALEALDLILPLAKGYVANNPVGSNQKYIRIAEAVLAKADKESKG